MRIKTLQNLYSMKQLGQDMVQPGLDELQKSISQTHDMYLFMLDFPYYLGQLTREGLEKENLKYYPNAQKIADLKLLRNSSLANMLFERTGPLKKKQFANWNLMEEQLRTVYEMLLQEEFVKDYLVFEAPNFEQQQYFLETLYDWLFNVSEPFNELMTEVYPFWDDDEPTIYREIIKTLHAAKEDHLNISAPVNPNADEVLFGKKLLRTVIEDTETLEEHIASVTQNWDPSRIAVIDLIVLKMAIAEFTSFEQIPVKVTINEYLDIIKNYSTPNSSRFVNGVLDNVRLKLEKENRLQKSGRGLKDS